MTALAGQFLTADMTVQTQLVVHECWSCGTLYAMDERLHNDRLNNGGSWYCPNGHGTAFKETEATRLNRLLKNAKADAEWERKYREQAENRLRATKGVVTKLRKRALEGECPFCGQHLRDLERHVARQHPTETPEPVEESAGAR